MPCIYILLYRNLCNIRGRIYSGGVGARWQKDSTQTGRQTGRQAGQVVPFSSLLAMITCSLSPYGQGFDTEIVLVGVGTGSLEFRSVSVVLGLFSLGYRAYFRRCVSVGGASVDRNQIYITP